MRTVCLIFFLVLLMGCQQELCRSSDAKPTEKVKIVVNRLEEDLFACQNSEEVYSFLKSKPAFTQNFLHSDQYPDLKILSDRLAGLIEDPSIDTLYREALMEFDQASFEAKMNEALSRLKYYYPELTVPEISTVVTGFYNDLYISESELIIGIDYFIGDNATYRPNDIPMYILSRYKQPYLVPTLIKFLVGPYVANGKESTLLSEMISYGKAYYFLSRLLPCEADHLIIGFSGEQMADVKSNQEVIWASLLQNEVLYTTDEFVKVKFLGERPNVYEIGEKCPGRIGAWVGWQIVESYMDKWEIPMQEMLLQTNHHEFFAKSGYKPKDEN